MIKPLPPKASSGLKLNLMQKLLLLLGIMTMAVSSLPMMVILVLGLLPTITVILTDSKNSNKITIIGCLNLSGVFIGMVRIINQYAAGMSISVLGNIFNIVIMLGCAAIGMILYFELPNLFILISKASAQHRLHSIDDKIEKLTQKWGSEAISDLVK